MTFDEFKLLAKAMKSVYTSQSFLPDGEAIKTWYYLLEDMPYQLANIAIQRHMATNKFPPTPAEIRQAATKSIANSESWADGWRQFRRAVRLFGYYRQEEALESMDEITRKTVKRLGWKELCESQNQMQDRANFRMVYEQEAQDKNEVVALPAELRSKIQKLRGEPIKALGGGNGQ